ncbi:PLC-like phosphodiesterase [Blastocladiella britannica]|nr:PLC-like phosphodiesterase [Blastocladiella britannica]
MALAPTNPSTVNCVGHRGVAALYPENTLPSFLAALDSGADGIELDIRLSKDNEVVVLHDPTLDRTTTGTGNVRDYNWAELQALRAIKTHLGYGECFATTSSTSTKAIADAATAHPDAGPAEAAIPRLVDVLDMVASYSRPVTVIIDIKWDNPLAIMTHLRRILDLPQYSALLPRITLGIWSPHYLWSLPPASVPVKRSFIGTNLTVARLCSGSVDNFSLHHSVILGNLDWVRKMRSAGYSFSSWTVDKDSDLKAIIESGVVENVISDCVAKCVDAKKAAVRGAEAFAAQRSAQQVRSEAPSAASDAGASAVGAAGGEGVVFGRA